MLYQHNCQPCCLLCMQFSTTGLFNSDRMLCSASFFKYAKYNIAHNQTIIKNNNIIIKTLNICSGKTHQSALKDLSINQIKCLKQSTKIHSWNQCTHSVSTAVFKIFEWRKQCVPPSDAVCDWNVYSLYHNYSVRWTKVSSLAQCDKKCPEAWNIFISDCSHFNLFHITLW